VHDWLAPKAKKLNGDMARRERPLPDPASCSAVDHTP
jgi:hypothetical protein